MNKRTLVTQLAQRLLEAAQTARHVASHATEEAREGATAAEKREDSRVSLENSGLARGQARRAEQAALECAALEKFEPGFFPSTASIGLGAIVEVEGEEGGRTFFLAPAGAGEELTVPDGDGYLTVVTPNSPVGRSVLGKKVGDSIEFIVGGEPRELTITYLE